jgi:ABC-type lipoprotein release transport system permease subunit
MSVRRKRIEPWQRAAVIAVLPGVGFSVLLISVATGVQGKISGAVDNPTVRATHLVNVDLINTILLLLTAVISAAVLAQTAAMVVILGITNMRARREEIALRRQSGVLRSRLMWEFTASITGACILGGILGDAVGAGTGLLLRQYTVLPVVFTPLSLLSAFPTTVALALVATLYPAWRFAGASPALLRKV